MKTPTLSGLLQTDDKELKNRKILGKIALWLNESENEKAPEFGGILETEKGKFRISLWRKKVEEKSSIFHAVNLEQDVDFICRYCHSILEESDILWDACNNCASVHEGFHPPGSKS
jgi:hypothetical protein